jgi:hypothetical protein
MSESYVFKIMIAGIISFTLIVGGLISGNIITTSYTKDLVKLSLEKGQNPVYVKCAMESSSSNECKTMMTVIAISKSDK